MGDLTAGQRHALDRPVWTALATRQQALSVGDAVARRYRPEINLFAAGADPADPRLAGLPGTMFGTVEPEPILGLPDLKAIRRAAVDQMVAQSSPGLASGFAWLPLGDADAAEMLALATLTEPGPFFAKTHQMGRFIGVREGGKLIAMAGERMRAPGFIEISGVCTHPDHRGRGLAGKLMRAVIDRIVREGDAAFLHVYPYNKGAIGLYETLGFRFRARLEFTIWARD